MQMVVEHLLSIDPGAKGAAVKWYRGTVDAIYAGDGWATQLVGDLKNCDPETRVVIEKAQAMPGQGVASMFRYGQGYGEILGACAALGLSLVQVSPRAWQSLAYRGIAGEGKARSIEACRRILPKINLVREGCKKPHDGVADAALIGWWAFLHNGGRG
jgi:hypothetical protein